MPTTGASTRPSHGAAALAAMLSSTKTSAVRVAGWRSQRGPARTAQGSGTSGIDTNVTSAPCRGARSARRRWKRYPPVTRCGSPTVRSVTRVRVIHVAPTAFGRDGLFGGGERYPYELARALAQHVSCELVTFGPDAGIRRDGPLTIRVVRPLTYLGGHPARPVAPALPGLIRDADIVHVHH